MVEFLRPVAPFMPLIGPFVVFLFVFLPVHLWSRHLDRQLIRAIKERGKVRLNPDGTWEHIPYDPNE